MERSGAYINERIFQIGAAGGFALSMYVESGSNDLFDSGVFWIKSSTDFFNVCRYFIAHPDERIPFMEALQKEVLEKHTYVHRIRSLLEFLDVKTI